MANTDGNSNYFIRIRGRVLGPYTPKQLNTLRVRGQFSQSNEISTDGQSWESAATLEELFGTPTKKSHKRPKEVIEVADQPSVGTATAASKNSTDALAIWHYSVNDEQLGPVALTELQQMLAYGRLTLHDLVWRDGMSEWSPVSEIAEVNQIAEPTRRKRTNTDKGSRSDVSTSDEALPPHFLDYLLDGLRSVIDESFVAAMGKSAIELGRYAIYISIIVNAAFFFYAAVKYNVLNFGLAGVGFAALALMLQYSAVKSCGAINQLIRATTLRMSSTAFLDSMVVMLLVGGVVVLVSYSVTGIQLEKTSMVFVGIAIFLLCEQLALILLHPKALGITISNRASTGEEAVTILTFFIMLPLRFVPTVFALGSSFSTIGTGVAFYLLFKAPSEKSESYEALIVAATSSISTLTCAAFPFAMYVYFVFAYLMVDVIRSILVMPNKIDELAKKTVGNRNPANDSDERDKVSFSEIAAN